MKAYTDISQSKKLTEILPLESADMYYEPSAGFRTEPSEVKFGDIEYAHPRSIRCWGLAALLDVLPFSNLSKDKLGGDKEGWMVSVYPDNCRYDSCWHDNPVDACVEMVVKLNEMNLL